jgi:hypothetical protein
MRRADSIFSRAIVSPLEEAMMKLLAAAVRTIAGVVPGLVRDLAGLSGVGLVSYGAWMIYQSRFEVMVAIRRLPL